MEDFIRRDSKIPMKHEGEQKLPLNTYKKTISPFDSLYYQNKKQEENRLEKDKTIKRTRAEIEERFQNIYNKSQQPSSSRVNRLDYESPYYETKREALKNTISKGDNSIAFLAKERPTDNEVIYKKTDENPMIEQYNNKKMNRRCPSECSYSVFSYPKCKAPSQKTSRNQINDPNSNCKSKPADNTRLTQRALNEFLRNGERGRIGNPKIELHKENYNMGQNMEHKSKITKNNTKDKYKQERVVLANQLRGQLKVEDPAYNVKRCWKASK